MRVYIKCIHYFQTMVGRKSKISYDDLLPILRSSRDEIFDSDGIPHCPSNPCWKSIADNFPVKVEPKHIYTLVKCKRIVGLFDEK